MQEKIEIISNNRKVFHSYTIIDKYESGMILLGSEVKSLREKKLNLKDSFVTLKKNRFFLVNAHISPYSHTGIKGHEPTRVPRWFMTFNSCLLYTSPSPRDLSTSRMPSSA